MKNIFITGGTSGLGKALAEFYLNEGHRVGICGRDRNKFDKSELNNRERLFFYDCDIQNLTQLQNVLNEFIKKSEKLDLFIANAGVGEASKSSVPNFERDRFLTEINVLGFLNSIEVAIARMVKQKSGHFVAISSLGALVGMPGNAAYCASKSYVAIYCESLAIDMKKYNVSVTCVQPGYIQTPLTEKNNHPMPQLMSAKQAALKINMAIKKKKLIARFPWPFSAITKALSMMPKVFNYYLLAKIKYRE
ncbi:MAG: SDR family NAD(P)-dependent oxidoreductase [Halobacteriovoraceae bacterium]|nr:SDR family NAD(P)-dependent oxidoreductase [Halobacteriovoraceae bacterium]